MPSSSKEPLPVSLLLLFLAFRLTPKQIHPLQKFPVYLFMGGETVDFTKFEGHYQYCKRCTELKYRKSEMVSTLQEVRAAVQSRSPCD
jgi:hypothetical protein